MEEIKFNNAFFLKLGSKGAWEYEATTNSSKARIDWSNIPILEIQNENWDVIRSLVEIDFKERGKKNGATQDFNALKLFSEATENDVFITFAKNMMYWCMPEVGKIQEDTKSKFRTLKLNWRNTDIKGNKLYINSISGKITKTQGFMATLCRIEEKDALDRIINNKVSPIVEQIKKTEAELQNLLTKAFSDLHWKDCETLADLIFNQSGLQRISQVGSSMKYMDIELENALTKERYIVQVKAHATGSDFNAYVENFPNKNYTRLFFVSFNHDKSLDSVVSESESVILLKGKDLAALIIKLGLTNWVVDKIA